MVTGGDSYTGNRGGVAKGSKGGDNGRRQTHAAAIPGGNADAGIGAGI